MKTPTLAEVQAEIEPIKEADTLENELRLREAIERLGGKLQRIGRSKPGKYWFRDAKGSSTEPVNLRDVDRMLNESRPKR